MWFEAFGWAWLGMGVLSGCLLGMVFHQPRALGGYDAWARRLVRLGDIAFFGTGILCLLMAGTLARHEIGGLWAAWASIAMAIGAVTMPLCCLLAAWRARLRVLFAAPVSMIGAGVGIVGVRMGLMAMDASRLAVGGGS